MGLFLKNDCTKLMNQFCYANFYSHIEREYFLLSSLTDKIKFKNLRTHSFFITK